MTVKVPLTRLGPLGFFRRRELRTKQITFLSLLHDERCAKCFANLRDEKILLSSLFFMRVYSRKRYFGLKEESERRCS